MHYTVIYVQIPLSKRLKCRDRGVSIIRCMTKHHLPTMAACAIMEKVIYVRIYIDKLKLCISINNSSR